MMLESVSEKSWQMLWLRMKDGCEREVVVDGGGKLLK